MTKTVTYCDNCNKVLGQGDRVTEDVVFLYMNMCKGKISITIDTDEDFCVDCVYKRLKGFFGGSTK